ncbi:MAG TPA: DUF4440 domain-containing protein [Thermoflexales bacterium]|nr:DUF4440 domain-containing protein [Thermoflexales bacterium]HQW34141.1 DUF4440 domain-containing protein [Thermoflexales bacterium]HQZ21913.1 DUF4440 domain-containing protein [Thermoflexales bacterium]HQZ98747.1 DUF4440 domain-containing protein [Thermoflexales bacterium]
MDEIQKNIGHWVEMWNTYDLSQVNALFLCDDRLTYFSSEQEGAVIGIDAVREHHRRFGFVEGGKISPNKLWLDDLHITDFDSCAVVTGIWFFRRAATGQVQRGPVTFVYLKQPDGYRLAHLNFGNYK